MKHKLMRDRVGLQKPPLFLPDLYQGFRSELLGLLDEDTSFKANYLKDVFESKLTDGSMSDPADIRRSRAITKWLETEKKNLTTNVRLMHSYDEDEVILLDDKSITYGRITSLARHFIASTIGTTVDLDLLRGSFSGGASTSIKRGVGTVARKFQDGTNITDMAIMPYMQMARMAKLLPHDLKPVKGNVLFTVEKSSTIDRVACKEPELNMYCQKAVGDFFRRSLRRKGIDLNDQKINQDLARLGSIDGSLATLDLSSASDSVTKQIVIELLPLDWTLLLFDLRSPFTCVDGIWHENEMISSMGNGFTFELESLIFWALIKATMSALAVRGTVGVYGDDLICPSGLSEHLITVLNYFGFSINEKKSFWTGSFRESCGKHWNSGLDVTPFFVKSVPLTVPEWCNLLNSLRRWAHSISGICDPRYYDLWRRYSEHIPKSLHGSKDMNRSDALVSLTTRNTCTCRPKVNKDKVTSRRYQLGAYAFWLSTSEARASGIPPLDSELDLFSFNGELVIRRKKRSTVDTLDPPGFPQEFGVSPLTR